MFPSGTQLLPSSSEDAFPKPVSSRRPPPTVLHDKSCLDGIYHPILDEKNIEYRYRNIGAKLKIHLKRADDYRDIVAALEGDRARYHCFYLRKDKVQEVVVRNVLEYYSEQNIGKELTRLGFAFKDIHRIKSSFWATHPVNVITPRSETFNKNSHNVHVSTGQLP